MRSFLIEAALCAILAISTKASSIPYFQITNIDIEDGYDGFTYLGLTIKDPNTGTSTNCNMQWEDNGSPPAPSSWTSCNDKTFSMKIDAYVDPIGPYTEADMSELRAKQFESFEFKHQYRGAGKTCVKSNGPECTTARGYLTVKLNAESAAGDSGSKEAPSYNAVWAGPYNATIFSTCNSGCGISAGND